MDKNTVKNLKDMVAGGDEEGAKQLVEDFLSSFDYKQGYRDSVDFLDENFAFFLTHILNMGTPHLDASVPTAAVMIPKDGKPADFRFAFNPNLFALLTTEERAFVLGHETLHVLLNHLSLLVRGQAAGKFKDGRKFNIAADCVINDWLVNMGLEPGRLADFGAFGPKVVGYDCSNATVSEVYVNIPEQDPDEQGEGGEGSGDPLEEFLKGAGSGQGGQGFDDHEWLKGATQEQQDAAEAMSKGADMPEDLTDKKDDDQSTSKYGNPGGGAGSGQGALQSFIEKKGVTMAWAELLREIDPDAFKSGGDRPRPSYHKARRKIIGVANAYDTPIILPVEREVYNPRGECPAIFMALDVSGSCAHHANTFVTLARSVPQKKIKLFAATFSDGCEYLDLENPKWRGGGTSFSPIENYIRTKVVPELGHYPKAVVVVTDGEGHFGGIKPEGKNADKWLWLLTDGGTYASRDAKGGIGRFLPYEDFAKGVTPTKI